MRSKMILLWIVASLLLATSTAFAQSVDDCTGLSELDRKPLTDERTRLSKKLETSAVDASELSLREVQERLIEVIYKLDCLRPDVTVDPLITRSAADSPRNVEIPVLFATNRNVDATNTDRLIFGADIAKNVVWGKTVVSVPTKRQIGDLTLPEIWKFELAPDLGKHFVITKAVSLGDKQAFAAAMKKELGSAQQKSLLLFVHGYRVTFDEAAMRAAQLAHDLNFKGVPMFFSWPSKGNLQGYWHDEEAVQLSEDSYDELLDIVTSLGFDSVYVVAHSMGNRLVTSVHRERIASGKKITPIKEVLLAAADISVELFNQKIAPALSSAGMPRTTIYTSSGDVALQASKIVHSFRRLGDASAPIYRQVPFETVDASNVATVRRAAGHSYIFDSPTVIADVQRLLIQGQPAVKRTVTLERANDDPPFYWKFKRSPK